MLCHFKRDSIAFQKKWDDDFSESIFFFYSTISVCTSFCFSISFYFLFFSAFTRVCCVQVLRLSLCFGQLSISRVSITQQSAANIMYRSNIVPHFKIGDRWICALECCAEVEFYRHVRSVAFLFEHLKRIFFLAPKNFIKYLLNQCEHSSNCIYIYIVCSLEDRTLSAIYASIFI